MWKFWKRGREIITPRLTTRENAGASRVDLLELTPELTPYLGQLAYLELAFFTLLTRAVEGTEVIEQKDVLSAAAQTALEKYHALSDLIREAGDNPAEVMRPFSEPVDDFIDKVSGEDWAEQVTSAYLVSGLLHDFFGRLGDGLPGRAGSRIEEILERDSGRAALAELLTGAIAADARLGARLALWGRRLVGDTMLIARSALVHTGNLHRDEARIEPVFTELLNDHVHRMSVLGLTA